MSVRRFTCLSNALSKKAENFDINCTAGFAIAHFEEPSLEQLRDPSESTTEAFPSWCIGCQWKWGFWGVKLEEAFGPGRSWIFRYKNV
jgi:hypothetical protein